MISFFKRTYRAAGERYPSHMKILRFVISGGTATVTNIGLLFILVHFFHIWYVAATVITFLAAFGVSFVLQKFWTFDDRSKGDLRRQLGLYFCTLIGGLLLNTSLVYLYVERLGINYLIAQVIAGALIAVLNYFFYQTFIFHKGEKPQSQTLVIFFKKAGLPILFLALFFALRLPGLHLPYYQDEWKNIAATEASAQAAGQFFAHPPLLQIFFRSGVGLFGGAGFRIFPLIFALLGALLFWLVVKGRAGKKAAWISLFLFVACFFNVWAALQADVDGAVLPMLFLLAVFLYDRARAAPKKAKLLWALFVVSLLAGILVKLSFVIVIGALAADFLWEHRAKVSRKAVGYSLAALAGFAVLAALAMAGIHLLYPSFEIGEMVAHAMQFVHIGGRDYVQIAVQAIKALFYLSPLLLVPLVFVDREILRKFRIFWLYLVLGSVFYFIIFDFSRGALDKYLMFSIAPLATLSGAALLKMLSAPGARFRKTLAALGAILAGELIFVNFLPHIVLPLYPKTLWFSRVLHFKWAMLNPFLGGSGPMPFYVSFLFIMLSFIASAALALAALWKREWRPGVAVILILIGIAYNGIFAEELSFGKINGNASDTLRSALAFIAASPEITKVLTFSDIGSYELSKMGKSAGRFYAAPQFEDHHRELFAAFKGDYLVVGIPPLGPDTFYGQFFSKCRDLFKDTSGAISANVYSCDTNPK